jgi:hypothetical protein
MVGETILVKRGIDTVENAINGSVLILSIGPGFPGGLTLS